MWGHANRRWPLLGNWCRWTSVLPFLLKTREQSKPWKWNPLPGLSSLSLSIFTGRPFLWMWQVTFIRTPVQGLWLIRRLLFQWPFAFPKCPCSLCSGPAFSAPSRYPLAQDGSLFSSLLTSVFTCLPLTCWPELSAPVGPPLIHPFILALLQFYFCPWFHHLERCRSGVSITQHLVSSVRRQLNFLTLRSNCWAKRLGLHTLLLWSVKCVFCKVKTCHITWEEVFFFFKRGC